jgi:predicted MFS family arabinose efflux permease
VQAALLFVAGIGSLFFAMGSSVPTLAICRAVIGLGLSGGLMAAFKANALWLPQARVPLANSVVVAFGGVGVFVATAPADWTATHFGWRAIFYLLAVVTALVAAVVFFGAPHGNGEAATQRPSGNWVAQLKGLGPVFTNAMFWRIAPMVAFVTGGFIAVQSLWTARWLTDVRLLDRAAVADDLMAMAVAFSVGSLLTGFIADWAGRRGIGLKAVMIGAFVVLAAAELGLTLDIALPGWLLVTLLGLSGSGANLAYVSLSEQFGPAMAGRAQTSLNLLLFLAAALIQSGIGAALDLVEAAGISGGAPFHYALVLGLLVAVQIVSVIWFAGLPDARK